MSQRQWKRLDAVERIGRGGLTVREAAEVLGLSERQVRRLRRAVEERGARGVMHGNTGRAPAQRISEAVREQVIDLRRTKYAGFSDQHFTEKLCEVEELRISRASVQRLLRAAGIGPPRRRRPPQASSTPGP
jgi:transposase